MTPDERTNRHAAIGILLRSVSDTIPGEHDRLRNLHGHALTLWHDAEVGGASWRALTSLPCGSRRAPIRAGGACSAAIAIENKSIAWRKALCYQSETRCHLN